MCYVQSCAGPVLSLGLQLDEDLALTEASLHREAEPEPPNAAVTGSSERRAVGVGSAVGSA